MLKRMYYMNEFLNEDRKKKYTDILADNLPVLRAKLGISQKQLADRIGMSRNMIARIEIKEKQMSWTTFMALSFLFLKNEKTEPIFKTLNIYDEDLNNYLMYN